MAGKGTIVDAINFGALDLENLKPEEQRELSFQIQLDMGNNIVKNIEVAESLLESNKEIVSSLEKLNKGTTEQTSTFKRQNWILLFTAICILISAISTMYPKWIGFLCNAIIQYKGII